MRSPLLLVVLVLALALGVFFWSGAFDGGEPIAPPANVTPTDGPGAARTKAQATGSSDGLPAGTVATRTNVRPEPSEPLADAPTAWLCIVDHAGERPLAGAPVRRVRGGTELGFSDERGLVPLALRDVDQLAVAVDGYLVRMVPARLGTSEQDPQQVRLVADRFSLRRRFRFVGPEQQPIADVFVRFKPRDAAAKSTGKAAIATDDPIVQRAWMEHTMLAAQPVCADVPVQLGVWSEQRVHRLADGGEVRFVVPGEFTLEAATTNGFVGTASLTLAAGAVEGPEIVVAMQPGVQVGGQVVALGDGRPLGGATVQLQGGEPLGLVATTDADGAFRLGPLLPGALTLHVHHGDHEPQAYGPVAVPGAALRIPLRTLPQTTLRGRVRSRPDLQPIAGAAVLWRSESGGNPVAATTAADGTFVLPATGQGSGRLAVQAVGFLTYAELVAVGAPFADYDVWPADPNVRVERGLTAMLEGVLRDASGAPIAGATVRWTPQAPTPGPDFTGRRALEGAVLQLPLGARTGEDGAFRLETNQFGPGRLSHDEVGLDVQAVAGAVTSGLRLQP